MKGRSGALVSILGALILLGMIGGYFLLEAADIDEAIDLASKWPSARLGRVEVRPVEDGLDPERRYEAPPDSE